MDWNRSETIGLAKLSCTHCHGDGLRRGKCEHDDPCNCVLRAIFRACYTRFRYCATKEKSMSRVTLQLCNGKSSRITWARKEEDYLADFCLVSKRSLNAFEYDVFRFHFLLGANWKLCCRRLQIDRGTFFHAVYRVQQKLGRIFRELKPYSLYPLDEYFGGKIEKHALRDVQPKVIPIRSNGPILRPPVQKIA